MTDQQQEFYMLLCMTGRTEEACWYREKCISDEKICEVEDDGRSNQVRTKA